MRRGKRSSPQGEAMTDLSIRGISIRDMDTEQGAPRERIVRGFLDPGHSVDELFSLCDPPAEFQVVKPLHVEEGAVPVEHVSDCRVAEITIERARQVRISA